MSALGPVLLLMLALRVVLLFVSQPGDPRLGPPSRAVDPSVILLGIVLASCAFAGLGLLVLSGAGWLLIALSPLLVLTEPWLLARWVAIPRGWARAAFWLTRLSAVQWQADRAGGARFAAAWAATRRRPRDEAVEGWIESTVGDGPVTAAMLAAHALLAASRGDRVEARRLFRAVECFDVRPRIVQRVSREWQAAEAATRGAWEEVERLAALIPSTPPTQLLGAVAQRLLDRPDAPDVSAFAARWRRTRTSRAEGAAIFQRALRARHRPPAPGVPEGEDALRSALLAHRAASLDPSIVPEAARRWPRAFAEVEAPPLLRDQVVADLADLAERGRVRLASLTDGLGPEVADGVRERHLARLDVAVKALGRRVAERAWLDAVAEAREWIAIKALYEELVVVGGESAARAAYHPMFLVLTDLAVDLYNHRQQPYLFRAITRWLHEEGARVGDERACELLTQNLHVSRGYSA